MSSTDWAKIKRILVDVLAREPLERQQFLDERSLDGVTLAEIGSLLEIADDADNFMSVPASEFSYEFFDVAEKTRNGDLKTRRFGPYEVERELGVGGMGAVFLAKRCDGKFEQRVAIKLIRSEFNVARVREAFNREIEIQSGLEHPNIARILDTGTTDDGIPYIAMEYVEGEPLDSYCKNLSLRDRLKVFNQACQAVSFAHQNLIVHRDIKPTNIIVSPNGTPKLLDFGLSKLLVSIEKAEAVTLLGSMTPEYASPEQARGEKVTTAADIYSLGVVLYKTLTGKLPYKVSQKHNVDFAREITDSEPAPPSRAVSTSNESIRPMQLEGDLDNIILKALSKEPNERYQTVNEFSNDIWRYMDGLPVLARPATFSYKLAKFYKRNRLATVAAIVLIVTLIAGAGGTMWQAQQADASRVAAVLEMKQARSEREKAEKISRFLMRIVSYANPRWHAEGFRFQGEARVIDALNDMAAKIDNEFADQPDVLAELHHQFCDAYNSRKEPGTKEKARAHALRALELRRLYYGEQHELVAKDMGFVYWTAELPRSEETVEMFSNAIEMMRATNSSNRNLPYFLEDYIANLTDDAEVERAQLYLRLAPQPAPNDRYMAADQYFDELIGLLRQHFDEESPQVIFQKCRGSVLKLHVNKMAEAENLYQACLQDREILRSHGNTVSPTNLAMLAEFEKLIGRNP